MDSACYPLQVVEGHAALEDHEAAAAAAARVCCNSAAVVGATLHLLTQQLQRQQSAVTSLAGAGQHPFT